MTRLSGANVRWLNAMSKLNGRIGSHSRSASSAVTGEASRQTIRQRIITERWRRRRWDRQGSVGVRKDGMLRCVSYERPVPTWLVRLFC